jgi:hypothetical protein
MQARIIFKWSSLTGCALALSACIALQPEPPVLPAVAAPASAPALIVPPPAPAPPDPADAADLASRRFLAYHDQVRQMPANDLANEITRLSALVSASPTSAPADSVLELSIALAQQHNGGDLARAIALLEPLTKSSASELAAWQPLARLLLGRVAEQRRLEDQLAREAAQRREQQRSLQLLNEKLEALKAIERSMTTRPPGAPAAPAALPAASGAAPSAPKAP